jgi:ketosteroid isomerase-like protein
MTRDDVRATLQRHLDLLNRHDVPSLAAMYAADAELVSPMFQTVRGRQAIAESFVRLFEVFPDYAIAARDALLLIEGDRAAQFATVTGTHRLALYGLQPTGQEIQYHAARLFTFADGLIVGEQRIYDFAGVLDRLEKTRIDRELALASAVQRALMAHTASAGAFFELVSASLPCRAIGGDFLEYRDLPSGAFGLAIGDVSGKGPAAALVAAMLQGMFSLTGDSDAGCGDVIGRLNRALFRRGIAPRYATFFYGILEADGRFTYSNAGHPPPLLVSASGVRALTAGGPILGVFESAAFQSDTVTLLPGDTLICYSDGVTDAESPDGTDFGLDRIIAAARAQGTERPRAFVEGLLAAVDAFADTAASVDDATIAVLRYR